MLEGPAPLPTPTPSALFLPCAVQHPLALSGRQWIRRGGFIPPRSVPSWAPCTQPPAGRGPRSSAGRANCSSTSKIQVFGAFPGVSCEMVPGGCVGGMCPLQSGASPALARGVSPPGTLGHRGGGNAQAGGCKPLPCWRANRAYAHQAALPPESCGNKPLVIQVPRDPIPTVGSPRGPQRLRVSLHFPTALRSQGNPIFLP